jgi:hypothetical protein
MIKGYKTDLLIKAIKDLLEDGEQFKLSETVKRRAKTILSEIDEEPELQFLFSVIQDGSKGYAPKLFLAKNTQKLESILDYRCDKIYLPAGFNKDGEPYMGIVHGPSFDYSSNKIVYTIHCIGSLPADKFNMLSKEFELEYLPKSGQNTYR